MTAAELRRALELLPPGSSLTLSREALLAALEPAPEPKPNGGPSAPDRLLSARQAAPRLGVSVRYLYAHRSDFPFTRELPSGGVRFSERGLETWLRR